MMAHVKIVDRWEKGKPTPVPDDARIRAYRGGEMFNPFFANVYVDDHLLMRVQHSDHDTTALPDSASPASDHVRYSDRGRPAPRRS